MKLYGIKKERLKVGYRLTPLFRTVKGRTIPRHNMAKTDKTVEGAAAALAESLVVAGFLKE